MTNAKNKDLTQLRWVKLCGSSVDNIQTAITAEINRLFSLGITKDKIKIITACDSQRRGTNVTYVTVIIILNAGHGGNAFYTKEIEDYTNVLHFNGVSKYERTTQVRALIQRRLWTETSKAVNCALWVDNTFAETNHLKVSEIHVDINTNKKYKSAELSKAILGYIDACGFKAKVKPDAWGASGIANSKTR